MTTYTQARQAEQENAAKIREHREHVARRTGAGARGGEGAKIFVFDQNRYRQKPVGI